MDLKGLLDGFSGVMSESGSETLPRPPPQIDVSV